MHIFEEKKALEEQILPIYRAQLSYEIRLILSIFFMKFQFQSWLLHSRLHYADYFAFGWLRCAKNID